MGANDSDLHKNIKGPIIRKTKYIYTSSCKVIIGPSKSPNTKLGWYVTDEETNECTGCKKNIGNDYEDCIEQVGPYTFEKRHLAKSRDHLHVLHHKRLGWVHSAEPPIPYSDIYSADIEKPELFYGATIRVTLQDKTEKHYNNMDKTRAQEFVNDLNKRSQKAKRELREGVPSEMVNMLLETYKQVAGFSKALENLEKSNEGNDAIVGSRRP